MAGASQKTMQILVQCNQLAQQIVKRANGGLPAELFDTQSPHRCLVNENGAVRAIAFSTNGEGERLRTKLNEVLQLIERGHNFGSSKMQAPDGPAGRKAGGAEEYAAMSKRMDEVNKELQSIFGQDWIVDRLFDLNLVVWVSDDSNNLRVRPCKSVQETNEVMDEVQKQLKNYHELRHRSFELGEKLRSWELDQKWLQAQDWLKKILVENGVREEDTKEFHIDIFYKSEEAHRAVIAAAEKALKECPEAPKYEEVEKKPTPEMIARQERSAKRHDALLNFLRSRGGVVRADHATRELLMNPEVGFYAAQVDLSSAEPEITTPILRNPAYAQALGRALFFLGVWSAGENRNRGYDEPVVVVEIGGGNGAVAKAFMELYNYEKGHGIPEMRYICVEPNPKHRAAQKAAGATEVLEGTAQNTGMKAGSVDVLFDHEVVDCLPSRRFKWVKKGEKGRGGMFIAAESFMVLDEKGVHVEYMAPEKDAGMHEMKEWLLARKAESGYYHYSPEYHAYWQESERVLRRGGQRVMVDYAQLDDLPIGRRNAHYDLHTARFTGNDLTHLIDFGLQRKIAAGHGFGNIRADDVQDFVNRYGQRVLLSLDSVGWLAMTATRM